MIWLPDIATTIWFDLAAAFFLFAPATRPRTALMPAPVRASV